MKKFIILLLLFTHHSQASFTENESLFYPGGMGTADSLHSNEWILSPNGWAAVGVADRLTISWDWAVATLGISAGLIRWNVYQSDNLEFALEGYSIFFPNEIENAYKGNDKNFKIWHKGGQGWLRLNTSIGERDHFRVHTYVGANHAHYQRYSPYEQSQFEEKTYENSTNPDFGLGFELTTSDWLKLHLNATYGNSFYFVDQISRKFMTVFTFHMAPFSKDSWGIFRTMRIELSGFYVHIPDADYTYTFPPLYPTLYWQF